MDQPSDRNAPTARASLSILLGLSVSLWAVATPAQAERDNDLVHTGTSADELGLIGADDTLLDVMLKSPSGDGPTAVAATAGPPPSVAPLVAGQQLRPGQTPKDSIKGIPEAARQAMANPNIAWTPGTALEVYAGLVKLQVDEETFRRMVATGEISESLAQNLAGIEEAVGYVARLEPTSADNFRKKLAAKGVDFNALPQGQRVLLEAGLAGYGLHMNMAARQRATTSPADLNAAALEGDVRAAVTATAAKPNAADKA